MMAGYEKVHPDHVAYYSLVNLRELLSRCGLVLGDVLCYEAAPKSIPDQLFNRISKLIYLVRPYFADGLIVHCRPAGETSRVPAT